MSTPIPIRFFGDIPSTSDLVKQELGKRSVFSPFAIVAKSQSAGRGRSGKTWTSPPGGLYVSLAVAQPLPLGDCGWIPLWAASQVALWLQRRFAIGVRIKWPNDLIFAGSKLAGILCESVVSGSNQRVVVIGVGMNVASIADHDPSDLSHGYPKSSLSEILETGVSCSNVEDLARDFCDAFFRTWELFSAENARTHYMQFALEEGQWLRLSNDRFAKAAGLGVSGQLRLAECFPNGDSHCREVSSVSDAPRWIHQNRNIETPLLIASEGNTSVQLAFFRNSRSRHPEQVWTFRRVASGQAQVIADQLDIIRGTVAEKELMTPIHFASVRRAEQASSWQSCFFNYGHCFVDLPKRVVRYRGQVDRETFGIDRLAQIESALVRYRSVDQPLLIVSSGTAMTLDVVDPGGEHLGGWIVPGLQLTLDALSQNISALPALSVDRYSACTVPLLGLTTSDAILNGSVSMAACFVQQVLCDLSDRFGRPPILLLTGGGAQVLRQAVNRSAVLSPNLAIDGYRIMALGGEFCSSEA